MREDDSYDMLIKASCRLAALLNQAIGYPLLFLEHIQEDFLYNMEYYQFYVQSALLLHAK